MVFALVGNQNSGKTTLFNALTGSNQHVGNFPGVTVEGKSGEFKNSKENIVYDLPGIYSIRTYSAEEKVSRDFIVNSKPDAIINIIDATNIERNLYLTLQLLELGIPTVLALNMMDELKYNGGAIDVDILSNELGIPVVPIAAAKNEGIEDLISTALNIASNQIAPKKYDFCNPGPVHRCIHSVCHVIEDHAQHIKLSARFCAMRLIEGDDNEFIEKLRLSKNELQLIEHSVKEMESECALDRYAALADMRYNYIENICKKTVKKPETTKERLRSSKIDSILTNKYLAIPLFVVIMALVFWFTFGIIGQPLSDLLSEGIDSLAALTASGLESLEINPVLQSLIIDGIFAGVGGVVSFLPIIIVLFFFLSILEDTGYMARVAFVMDRLLRKIGLSGRSFVPMIIGFGCTVPAIMATRTLSSNRDRKMTILLTPYMSCSAKIPVYAVICAAFFPNYASLVMIALYFGGMICGILAALVLNKTAFKGKPVPFVMELPNYRLPSPKNVFMLLWEKAKDFLQKAFTVIFVATVIIWFLGAFDWKFNYVQDASQSLLASLGQLIAPVFSPLGFNDWRVASSLVAGFTAKEAVISTLEIVSGGSPLTSLFTPAAAVSFLTFILLYTPCVAAVATMKRELGSKLQTLGAVTMQCGVAWIISLVVYLIANVFI